MTSPAAEALLLLALAGHAGDAPPAPWVYAGLPQQQIPATRFRIASIDGRRALRVEAERCYGNLLHPVAGMPAGTLQWTWRVDQPLPAANLRSKAGDDAALKVCAMFDLPRDRVPFVERQLLRMAEARLGEPIPSVTLCYVWDPSLPRDTLVENAYSRRLRFITLGGEVGRWQSETRNLGSDFGDESRSMPPLRALARIFHQGDARGAPWWDAWARDVRRQGPSALATSGVRPSARHGDAAGIERTCGVPNGSLDCKQLCLANQVQVRGPGEISGLALGADADNTGGHSIGWVESLRLLPQSP